MTQASFAPPLAVIDVRTDSGAHQHIKDTGVSAINVLGKDRLDMAFTCFKPTERDRNTLNGQRYEDGPVTGSPLLTATPA